MRKLCALLTVLTLALTLVAPNTFATMVAKEKVIVSISNPSETKAKMLKLDPEIGADYDAHVLAVKEVNAFIKTYLSSKYTKLPLSEKTMKTAFKTIGSDFSVQFRSTEVGIYENQAFSVSSAHNVSFEKGKSDKEWNMSSLVESSEGTGETMGIVTEIRQYKTIGGVTVYAILGHEDNEKETPFFVAFAGKSGKLIKSIGCTSYGFGYSVPKK